MTEFACGFEPFFNADSRLLILGSFPSVMSRSRNFYYGNPRNDFWRLLATFFGEAIPLTVEDKKRFLTAHRIALWDMVISCSIEGSADSTIKDYAVADLEKVLSKCPIERIILNGDKAYKIFLANYKDIPTPYIKLPSTSPANARRKDEAWLNELRRTFG